MKDKLANQPPKTLRTKGYEEATEQASSLSLCIVLSDCTDFLDIRAKLFCKSNNNKNDDDADDIDEQNI